ncbi:MAG: cytoplasmic protein [Deltaproteobacteria bacterium]|nr:MAG: cytoplasmic protein [Deltaproteobacteria bacterium]
MDQRKKTGNGVDLQETEGRPQIPASKFEVWGEEMIEKEVRQSGNSGRVYLPPEWIGKHVKIIRID